MLSIIVCSIDKDKCLRLQENIRDTIGEDVTYEFIVHDNLREGRPIAQVYNSAASASRYPYLLFIHEDAGFITHGWGKTIISKLGQKDCGVIGFAGSKVLVNAPGGWHSNPEWSVYHYIECGTELMLNISPDATFCEVAAIDGFAMFVSKEVWEGCKFDEKRLTGFHCYDIDFSLTVGEKYRNYVCTGILTYHDSGGNFNPLWLKQTGELYENKWKTVLPRVVITVEEDDLVKEEEKVWYRYLKRCLRYKIKPIAASKVFRRYPLTPKHLSHLLKYYFIRTIR